MYKKLIQKLSSCILLITFPFYLVACAPRSLIRTEKGPFHRTDILRERILTEEPVLTINHREGSPNVEFKLTETLH